MKKGFSVFFLLLFAVPMLAEELPDSGSSSKLPVIGMSVGAIQFIGDVGYAHLNEPFLSHGGFQVFAQFAGKGRLSPMVYFHHGVVSANEKTTERTLNFRTSYNSIGAQLIIHLVSQEKRRILVPFVSAGLEFISFSPKGDLVSAEGGAYYYWNDGTIRNVEQNSPNAGDASLVHRDYTYETDLREANLDGLGQYSTSSLSVPAGIGGRMNLSGRGTFTRASTVHFTFTDYLDNISDAGSGQRQGDSKNDKFVYSSVGFGYDLSAPRETPKKKKYKNKDYKHIDFNALAKEDQDKDGVTDLEDEGPDTPPNVSVDAKGRPLDGDQDGVPDYRDREMNSAKGALVTEDGRTLTDEIIAQKLLQDSIASLPTVHERGTESGTSKAKGIPDEYKKVDVDKDGIISSKEIGDAIDEFLAGKSSYDTDAFYRLIDFYFSQ